LLNEIKEKWWEFNIFRKKSPSVRARQFIP
jgi:hypothetical protein